MPPVSVIAVQTVRKRAEKKNKKIFAQYNDPVLIRDNVALSMLVEHTSAFVKALSINRSEAGTKQDCKAWHSVLRSAESIT